MTCRILTPHARTHGALKVNAIYAEPNAPKTKQTARAIADGIENLAEFLDARKIELPRRVPRGWETLRR